MIKINLNKVYHKFSDVHNPEEAYTYRDETSGFNLMYNGIVEYTCEDQSLDSLDIDKIEQLIISFEYIPFITFRVTPKRDENSGLKYNLISISPISLRNYSEQQDRMEDWGDFDEISNCIDNVISIIGGFINGLGKINENNWKNDE